MHRFMSQWSLRKKFGFLSFLGLALFSVPMYLFVHGAYSRYQSANREVQGLVPIKAVLVAIDLTQQHRGMSAMVLNGNLSAETKRADKQQETVVAYKAINDWMAQQKDRKIAEKWQPIHAAWPSLTQRISQKQISPKESFGAHTQLITDMMDLKDMLVEHFGLNLDANEGNHFIIKATLIQSPELMETLARLRGLGAVGHLANNTLREGQKGSR